jgi:hypothetical protein
MTMVKVMAALKKQNNMDTDESLSSPQLPLVLRIQIHGT